MLKTYISRESFFWEAFLFGKLKRDERQQKNRIEKKKEKRENTTNAKK